MIWARRFLRGAAVDARTYGEALLLLRSAEQEVKNRREALGKTFLGYEISDLEHLWSPWQYHTDWEDLEASSPKETPKISSQGPLTANLPDL